MPNTTDISWLDNLTPQSTRFEDTYYSRANGLEETRYVFIEGNSLPNRWKLNERPVIGELGFGTGLNFLATWHEVLNILDEDSLRIDPLTFISFEKYPMAVGDLKKALSPWPDLAALAEQLADRWQPHQTGWQRMDFGSATLHLFIGDALVGLSSIPIKTDAWYLDGFNPKTNPDLWSIEIMEKLHLSSNEEATLASYTAAGWVRRNLAACGFEIEKRKGFGHKRDMIIGKRGTRSSFLPVLAPITTKASP